ncbi:otolith matrix protein OMM-64-like [Lolium rigidum]|uniref:otolith matrix protein OMM-64-like n=1 Tax=Lolium rigidum TaxID=89674 RepID=UPI001F5CF017|nr:otolith matrix protein OMM-64-like [Lolium rigidum]
MSWFARSIANTLLSDGEDPRPSASYSPGSPPRGVREDLSELTDALANRFQGIASFLAAPTPGGSDGSRRAPNPAEIAGRFRAGLARLPGRQTVADLAKIASSLLPPEEDWSGTEAAGVTEDVVVFARDAAMRPELWLDFPFLPDDADSDDFDMTDAQQDHALAVESVAPELADLRIELSPGHISEGCFWKIYFVLLHPKLTKEAVDLLSTPQVLEAREQLSQNFQYQTKLESNEDTVAPTISNADGTVATPVEVVPSLKDQDASARATSFGNVDYGILETIHLDDAPSKDIIGDAGAVSSDNISSSVCVQLVPVLRDATELSQSEIEESIHALSKEDATEFAQSRIEESTPDFTAEDAEADEETVTLVDSFPSKEDQRKQPVSDLWEGSRVIIQKADKDDTDDDGDEWLEEDTGGSGSTPIQIADDDEDVSFSDLEEDDDAA